MLALVVHKGGFHALHHLEEGGIQGFPARTDTKMHSSILEYLRFKLVQMGVIGRDDRTFGACLIDDASIANRWQNPLTSLEKQRIAFWMPIIVSPIYSDLGLRTYHVKTLRTSSSILYLNRAFCAGIEIPRESQLLSRVDVDHESRFLTVQDRASQTWSTRDAAVLGGADPRAASHLAALRCALYLRTSMPKCRRWSADKVAVWIAAPVKWGGAGTLHGVARDVCTSVDAEVEFCHMVLWSYMRNGQNTFVKIACNLILQPYDPMSDEQMLFSSGSWPKLGHVSSMTIQMRAFKENLQDLPLSPIFLTALDEKMKRTAQQLRQRLIDSLKESTTFDKCYFKRLTD